MAKGKIIVMRLFGGLGNQLFQYAFLFALSRQGGKARLEASSYEHDDKRVCELHHFRVSLPIEGGPPPWAFRKSRIPACLRSLFAAPKYPHFREEKLREGVLGSNRTAYMNYIVPLLFPDNEMPAGRLRHWAELWREADITSEHVCGMPREQRAYLEAALAGRWIYLRLLQCFWKFKTARRKMFRLRFSKNGIDTLQILGYTLYSAKKLPRSSL